MLVTNILGNAVGIQYQGVQDQTETNQIGGPSAGVVIGEFRRGRLNKPMFVTQDTIRARLGHDPANPNYMAVQDCLDAGVPGIWVMRILREEGET